MKSSLSIFITAIFNFIEVTYSQHMPDLMLCLFEIYPLDNLYQTKTVITLHFLHSSKTFSVWNVSDSPLLSNRILSCQPPLSMSVVPSQLFKAASCIVKSIFHCHFHRLESTTARMLPSWSSKISHLMPLYCSPCHPCRLVNLLASPLSLSPCQPCHSHHRVTPVTPVTPLNPVTPITPVTPVIILPLTL